MNGTIQKPGIIACCILIGLWILILGVLPELSRWVRGVDKKGLPRELVEMDPAASPWFSVDDKPLLYWSRERDGSMRFWNRPTVTPDTRQPILPVSRTQRIEWENRRGEGLAKVPEYDGPAAKEPLIVQAEHWQPAPRAAEGPGVPQAAPLPAPRSWGGWQSRKLHPGLFAILGASGVRWVEVESSGRGEFQAEGGGRIPFGPGRHEFQAPRGNFRIHCGETNPFVVRYRVAGG